MIPAHRSIGVRRRLVILLSVVALVGVSLVLGPLSDVSLFAAKGSCLAHPDRPKCQSSTTRPRVTTTTTRGDIQPSFPIRASFYYPWFPEGWKQQGYNPFTNYTPSLGFYNGSDITVVRKQIAAMQYGGQEAGIASWWGRGTPTDGRIPLLLNAAQPTRFRWSLYYEAEAQRDPTVAQIRSDLAYIDQRYGHAPGYLRVGGRPVLFVYADSHDGCAMASRWAQANSNSRFFVVLKVFPGYKQCASQPAGWHQYAPSSATDSQAQESFSISPGFYKKGEASPRLARDPARWAQNVRGDGGVTRAVAVGDDVQRVGRGNVGRVGEAVGIVHRSGHVPRCPPSDPRRRNTTTAHDNNAHDSAHDDDTAAADDDDHWRHAGEDQAHRRHDGREPHLV